MPSPQPIGTPTARNPHQTRCLSSLSSAGTSLDAHSGIATKPSTSIQTDMVSCSAIPILATKHAVLVQTHCHQVPICQSGRIWCSGRWGPLGWGCWRKMQRRKKDRKLREKSGIWRVIFQLLGFVACHVSFIGVNTWENWDIITGGARPYIFFIRIPNDFGSDLCTADNAFDIWRWQFLLLIFFIRSPDRPF